MIIQTQKHVLNELLDQVAIELDVPPHKYKEAMDRFDAIKRHLEAGDYPRSSLPPAVYMQGSFRLGTVVRPWKDGMDADFDIDIVCEVIRKKNCDNPENLKNDVGDEVKAYTKKNSMAEPKNSRRCWALAYAPDSNGIGFHVDILPSLPDPEAAQQINRENYSQGATHWQYTQSTIAITNRDEDFNPPQHDWRSSNPAGYAQWFKDICDPGYLNIDNQRQKQLLFETYADRQNFPFEHSEEIPDALVRAPLQRVVQIMKRHRDIRFAGRPNEKHKPISMIITTLAARLYEGRASQYQTTRSLLRFIIDTLVQHAELVEDGLLVEDISRMQLIQRVDDTWYIPNPVNPHSPGDPINKGENFADRWHEDNHAKAKAFFEWVIWLKTDIDTLLNSSTDTDNTKRILSESFGGDIATRTMNRLNIKHNTTRSNSIIKARNTSISRFDVPHRENLRWKEDYKYDVELTAQIHRNGFRPSGLQNDSDPIPKWCSLTFQAATDVPKPFKVYWQIVNTGNAATYARDLRGRFIDAEFYRGGLKWDRETTKYSGMHWVECFIVKDGNLVARSGEFVVNIE